MPRSRRPRQRWPVTIADQLQYLNPHTDSILRAVIDLNGFLNAVTLQRAVELSLIAEPILACRFHEGWWRSYWEFDEPRMPDTYFQVVSTGPDMKETLSIFLAQTFDPHIAPQVRIRIFRSEQGDTLAVKMHHAVSDVTGFKDYLYLLAHLYRQLSRNPDFQPERNWHGKRDLSQVIRNLSPRDCLRSMSDRLQARMALPEGIFLWDDVEHHDEAQIITHSYPAEIFLPLKDRARAVHGTLNDLFLAVIFRAYRRITRIQITSPLCILYPIDLRRYLPERKAAISCNLVTCKACVLEAGIEDEAVEQTLTKVVEQTSRIKRGGMGIETDLLTYYLRGLWPAVLQRRSAQKRPPSACVLFSNLGEVDERRLYFHDVHINTAYITSSLINPPAFWITLCVFRASITLSIGFLGDAPYRQVVSTFLCCLDDEISTLVPAGEWHNQVEERLFSRTGSTINPCIIRAENVNME